VHSGGRKLRFVFRGVMVLKHNSNEKQRAG
jgi:hypothetical protein